MSGFRNDLVRAAFELMRDLTWVETLLPRFKEHGVDAAAMNGFREAWNQHCQEKDWEWWQNEAKQHSTGELDDMRMDYSDRLDALGMLQSKNPAASEQERFRQLVQNKLNQEQERPEQSHDIEMDI